MIEKIDFIHGNNIKVQQKKTSLSSYDIIYNDIPV